MLVFFQRFIRKVTAVVFLPLIILSLSGCKLELFDYKGPTSEGIGSAMIYTVLLMLIVVIPTIFLAVFIPYKYRASNKKNNKDNYKPEWAHSHIIEIIVWVIPIAIIIALAIEAYKTSYSLDPHKVIVSPVHPQEQPLKIQVVALDWKWLFIYPEEGIATINEISIPVNKPVQFLLTSDGAINSFFVPQLGGQLYAMSGMENKLNLMASEAGVYEGKSSNYSGYGFSGMRFNVLAKDQKGYENWVAAVKNSGEVLNDETYAALKQKTRDHPVEYFVNDNPLRFKEIIDEKIGLDPNKPTRHDSETK